MGIISTYINRFAARFADKIICVSHRQCDTILKYLPEIRGKTSVIYNPPPQLSAINKKISEEPTLIYAGGVSYIKGFTFFLDAIVKVLRKPKIRVYAIYGKEAPLKEKILA